MLTEKTLLTDFYSNKIKEYSEPLREGTPRGKKIGFSIQKQKAGILAGITNLNLRKISTELSASYGLLRQWNMETEFRELSKKSCEEFVDVLKNYIDSKISEIEKTRLEGSGRNFMPSVDELNDSVIYNESALYGLGNIFFDICSKEEIYMDKPLISLEIGKKIFGKNYKVFLKKYLYNGALFFDDKTSCNIFEQLDTTNQIAFKIFLMKLKEFLIME
jgi:hypothetical protein